MNSLFKKNKIRVFGGLWLLFFVVISLGFYSLFSQTRNAINKEISFDEEKVLHEIKSELANSLGWILKDLQMLSESFLEIGGEELLITQKSDKLEDFLLSFSRSRPGIYDQVRFLNLDGKEVIRVNRENDGFVVIPSAQLQDKAHRYYVQESALLERDQLYISKLDLNVDNNGIEIPYNPVMRVGTPVYVDGEKVGLLLLNIAFRDTLKRIEDVGKLHQKQVWIIDTDGYYVMSDNPDNNWGFMFDDGKENNIKIDNPERWFSLERRKIGQEFDQKDKRFAADYFDILSGAHWHYFDKSNIQQYGWHLVAETPSEAVAAQLSPVANRFVFSYLGLMLCLLVASYYWYRSYTQRLNAEESRRRSENNLRELYEYGTDSIVATDVQGKIKMFNKNAEAAFGYEISEVIGQPLEILIEKGIRDRHRGLRNGYIAQPTRRTMGDSLELKALRKDGTVFPVKVSLNAIESDDGPLMIATVRDITAESENRRKRFEQEQMLIQQSKMAAMGEMIGAIAHQWRQPLAAVRSILKNIEDAYQFDELSQEYVDRKVADADKNLQYMSQTINDFRSFFTPRTEKQKFCLVKAVLKAMDLVNKQMAENNITLELRVINKGEIVTLDSLDYDEYTHSKLIINGFLNELIQVILNLLSNAKDAILEAHNGEQGKIKIAILSVKTDEYSIQLEDTGGGIPEALANRIFEPYFTTKGQGQGTGIGLYMSNMIIEKSFNGTIKHLNGDHGAVFIIRLPK